MQILAGLVLLDLAAGYYLDNIQPQTLLYRYHPVLFWQMRERVRGFYTREFGNIQVSTNQNGFRDDDYTIPKPPGTFRIVTLGDSTIFGHGLNRCQTFQVLLQKELQRSYPGMVIEVLNCGVCGYSSYQGWYLLSRKILRYQPDLLVLAYLHSDCIEDIMEDKDRNPAPEWLKTLEFVLARSKLYRLLQANNHRAASLNFASFGLNRIYDWNGPKVSRVSPRDYNTNMQRMLRLARQHHSAVLLLALPFCRQAKLTPGKPQFIDEELALLNPSEPRYAAYLPATGTEIMRLRQNSHRIRLLELARSEAAPYLDIYSLWCLRFGPNTLATYFLPYDKVHPNARGAALMARALAEVCRKQALIRPAAGN